jgi:predicted DNA-binding helix-hairpin-helix protein
METLDKLRMLSTDSQYDLACACGTGKEDRRRRGLDGNWLYPVPLAAGGYGILFKTLISNACSSDCRYCPLRQAGNVARCSLTPDEVADTFTEQLRRRWMIGIFLSSGITGNADRTMQQLIDAASLLRKKHAYRGYIHLKVIPGASRAAIDAAMRVASAVSLNIEVPGRRHFEKLSRYKDFDRDIVEPLKYIAEQTAKGAPHARLRTSTQFIVGASDETDREILRYLDGIYTRLRLDRAYFSAYQATLGEGEFPGGGPGREEGAARLTREHRLYQADFLLRRYHFDAAELVFDEHGNFDLQEDPKRAWARRHPEAFPVRIATADKRQLLRVPGLGPVTVNRILTLRGTTPLRTPEDFGLRGKSRELARPFCDFS